MQQARRGMPWWIRPLCTFHAMRLLLSAGSIMLLRSDQALPSKQLTQPCLVQDGLQAPQPAFPAL